MTAFGMRTPCELPMRTSEVFICASSCAHNVITGRSRRKTRVFRRGALAIDRTGTFERIIRHADARLRTGV